MEINGVYYYDYRGSIPLTRKWLNIFRFAIHVGEKGYYLVEPPDPDEFNFDDEIDRMKYVTRYRKETRVHRFKNLEELLAALESRGIPPPKDILYLTGT